jgi:hypothetical protein
MVKLNYILSLFFLFSCSKRNGNLSNELVENEVVVLSQVLNIAKNPIIKENSVLVKEDSIKVGEVLVIDNVVFASSKGNVKITYKGDSIIVDKEDNSAGIWVFKKPNKQLDENILIKGKGRELQKIDKITKDTILLVSGHNSMSPYANMNNFFSPSGQIRQEFKKNWTKEEKDFLLANRVNISFHIDVANAISSIKITSIDELINNRVRNILNEMVLLDKFKKSTSNLGSNHKYEMFLFVEKLETKQYKKIKSVLKKVKFDKDLTDYLIFLV